MNVVCVKYPWVKKVKLMNQAIIVRETGGSEVLRYERIQTPKPSKGEVLLRHTAIGINFIDTYFRNGLYPSPVGLPFTPGAEAAGIIESVGEGITEFEPGDRVAYVTPVGAYANERVIKADRLVAIPNGIDDKQAAAIMLKGLTAQYLLRRTFKVKKGDTILFHAAAGGVGLQVCQWAKSLGATLIGTVGSEEKAKLAQENGCSHTILYRKENFVDKVQELTNGKGVDVVYDSVGKDTYPGSLECLKPFGTWASFGQSSGPITNFDLSQLSKLGSLYAARPTLFTHIANRADLLEMTKELFDFVLKGDVKIPVNQQFALQDAAEAHRTLEARKTTGASILLP